MQARDRKVRNYFESSGIGLAFFQIISLSPLDKAANRAATNKKSLNLKLQERKG